MSDLRILRYDELESTNTEAMSQARRGAAEGLCVVAGKQTAGRGRVGRSWVSEDGAGLYASILLRPTFEPKFFPLITLAAAVAVAEALEKEFGISSDIKWPNDVLANGRKISGILAEAAETPTGNSVVLGVGINLLKKAVPANLAAIATSIESEAGMKPGPDEALMPFLRHFFFHYGDITTPEGRSKLVADWSRRSSYAKGKTVKVAIAGNAFRGVTEGVDEKGALRVRTYEGNVVTVQAGDVESVRN